MIGDKIIPKAHHTAAAEAIHAIVKRSGRDRLTITIAGESGSGKSETAVELKGLFEADGRRTYIFHQDDYFHLPPKTNEKNRRRSIKRVGISEVNLTTLDENLRTFKRMPKKTLRKPLVDYEKDEIGFETMDPKEYEVAIAEGTYTTLLQHSDVRVFIDRNFDDTREHRKERAREEDSSFYDEVLYIEHKIISKHKSFAAIIVNKDWSVTEITKGKGGE
ncbi:MAG: hypothetical protein O7D32_06595 [bacterium]|nr:hypothetical protein [bacterium]